MFSARFAFSILPVPNIQLVFICPPPFRSLSPFSQFFFKKGMYKYSVCKLIFIIYGLENLKVLRCTICIRVQFVYLYNLYTFTIRILVQFVYLYNLYTCTICILVQFVFLYNNNIQLGLDNVRFCLTILR